MKSCQKIRQVREEKNWSQEYVAEKLGLSPNGYAKIERGETRLTLARLTELAEIFEMDILELIKGEIQGSDYHVGNNYINHGSDFTVYGAVEYKDLLLEIEKLKLIVQHQQEILAHKEQLLEQKSQALAMAQKMLAILEQQSSESACLKNG